MLSDLLFLLRHPSWTALAHFAFCRMSKVDRIATSTTFLGFQFPWIQSTHSAEELRSLHFGRTLEDLVIAHRASLGEAIEGVVSEERVN